jgi:hypothetical protein
MDKEFIAYKQNGIWPVAHMLHKMMKQPSVTVTRELRPVMPGIPGPLNDLGHIAYYA